jgi:hypothetical protein
VASIACRCIVASIIPVISRTASRPTTHNTIAPRTFEPISIPSATADA